MKAHIVLGVNGSGKTTYFRDRLKDEFLDEDVLSINADEIKIELVKQGLNPEVAKVQSGIIAISKISECIKKNVSFTFETTFTDDGSMGSVAIIKELKKAGYKIKGYNVYTDDVNLNIERVLNRSIQGTGHFVPENIIRQRVELYTNNFFKNKDLFDEVVYLNNTKFNFEKANYQDFVMSKTDKNNLREMELISKILEINPGYNFMTKEYFNSRLLNRIDNKKELDEKYLMYLEYDLETIKKNHNNAKVSLDNNDAALERSL